MLIGYFTSPSVHPREGGDLLLYLPQSIINKIMFYVYIITNKPRGTLYIGQTDDIVKRMWEHKNKTRQGFAKHYNLTQLVWIESFETRDAAFYTERRMKKWYREWKINLIEKHNPDWEDLTETLDIIR